MDNFTTGQNKRNSLIITGLGAFLGTLDSSIVNVSLPTISTAMNSSIDLVGWVVLAYAITIVSLLLVFGALAEKKGFGFTYKYGFIIFMTGSLLCGSSVNIYFLIFSRMLQGIGAALLMAVGPALITRSFPESERGRGLSVIAMVVSIGLMMGPPLGGFIIGWIGWRWIFLINIPVSLIGFIFSSKSLKNYPKINPDRKIFIPGAGSLATGLFIFMIGIFLYGRTIVSIEMFGLILLISAALFALFIYFENKPPTRLIGMDIFKNRTFSLSTLAMFLVFISLASVTILMPFYLERIKLLVPQDVGLYLMIIPVSTFFIAPLAGYLADKIQARIISTIGIAIMIVGIFLLRFLGNDSTLMRISVNLGLIGVGMGLFTTPNTSSIMGSVRRFNLGVASGINATTRTLGIAFGVGLAIAAFEYFKILNIQGGSDVIEAFVISYRTVYSYVIVILVPSLIFSLLRGNQKRRIDGDHA